MNRQELISYILNSDIFKQWHFFQYHFNFYNHGYEHPLAKSIVDLALDIENIKPQVGVDYINKLSQYNGKPHETKHYDQLMQVLAELLIVHKAITYKWGNNIKFQYEPTIGKSKKNPELIVTTENLDIGIEVKAPEFVKKHNERAKKNIQIPSRSNLLEILQLNKNDVMLPRDNPVKDFLYSTNEKMAGFKKQNSNFYSLLIIVWDDFIYEPISALLSPQAGLFTENSFAKDNNGIIKFLNVDSVIITRHLLPIKCGTRDEVLPDNNKHPLDYGRDGEFPFKVIIPNPYNKREIPKEVIDCFQLQLINPILGAEYLPSDIIYWMEY